MKIKNQLKFAKNKIVSKSSYFLRDYALSKVEKDNDNFKKMTLMEKEILIAEKEKEIKGKLKSRASTLAGILLGFSIGS
tara:strand:+ start:1327 stop:1563 length:237 start_codon:yes stop_codon:yes gene_type:complete